MRKLYRHPLSGHSHRVELFLHLLGLEFEAADIDLLGGEHKKEKFLKLNPFGQVPVLEDDGLVLADSNAILVYLARRYGPSWLPADPAAEARVQRWLSVAAGELAGGPAAARLVTVFGAGFDHPTVKARAHQLLALLEQHLTDENYVAGTAPTIADISLYTYVAHAPEGHVSLQDYPRVRAWLERIEGLRNFVPMQRTEV